LDLAAKQILVGASKVRISTSKMLLVIEALRGKIKRRNETLNARF